MKNKQKIKGWKGELHEIIYEADTKQGKLFDIILILAILLSIVLVMLESIKSFDENAELHLDINEEYPKIMINGDLTLSDTDNTLIFLTIPVE